MYRSLKEDTLAVNPLFTTSEAKDFLKVDTTADDTLIDNLIKAATQSCQIYTNMYFLDTVVTQYSDNWMEFYRLYKSPVLSITHVKYYDTNDYMFVEGHVSIQESLIEELNVKTNIQISVYKAFPYALKLK